MARKEKPDRFLPLDRDRWGAKPARQGQLQAIPISLMRRHFHSGLHLLASGSFLFLVLFLLLSLWKGAGLRSARKLGITMKTQLLLYLRAGQRIHGAFSSPGFNLGEKTLIHGEFGETGHQQPWKP